jgi:hypothetical protein
MHSEGGRPSTTPTMDGSFCFFFQKEALSCFARSSKRFFFEKKNQKTFIP